MAKNTIFLYIRMVVVMLIGLYTVRAYLDILGETDYGLYNVIGGVVAMFSFLRGTLSSSSQRFLSVALVQKDEERMRKVFSLNHTVFIGLTVICLVLLETVGVWFVNTQMTIPQERMFAANVVYQISVLSFIPQMLSVSYYALTVAREQMKIFAFVGILEAVLKLLFVFILLLIPFDRLIIYSMFMLFIQVLVLAIYMYSCKKHYKESHYKPYWNKKEALEILSFSGWHFLGTTSVVIRSNGVNILINMFFNPVVNAARAVAFQVHHAATQLTSNFFKAIIPQIYKSYAANQIEEMNHLIFRSTIICIFLTSILSVPLYFNAEFVLGLWLKEVPKYTVIFTQLALLNAVIDAAGDSTICSALATGNIKKFYLITGTLYILTLPIAYIFLKLGYDATSTMVVSIAISAATIIARALILKDLMPFKVKQYFMVVIRIILATILIGVGTYFSLNVFSNKWLILIFSSLVSTLLHCVIYLFFVCGRQDRNSIIQLVKQKIHVK